MFLRNGEALGSVHHAELKAALKPKKEPEPKPVEAKVEPVEEKPAPAPHKAAPHKAPQKGA